MKLKTILTRIAAVAGIAAGAVVLLALPAAAQRNNRPGGPAGFPSPAAPNAPPPAGTVPMRHGPAPGIVTPPAPQNQPGFWLGGGNPPPTSSVPFPGGHVVHAPGTVWRPGLFFPPEPNRPLAGDFPIFVYPYAGQPFCTPFAEGTTNRAFRFSGQLSCFSNGYRFETLTPFPPNFLSPALATSPWLIPSIESPADAGSVIQQLDMLAAIVARESGENIPSDKITQIALKNGFIFGVTDYWVKDNMFFYVTTYGKQRSVDLVEVDMDKSMKVNSTRGIVFDPQTRQGPAQQPAAPPVPIP